MGLNLLGIIPILRKPRVFWKKTIVEKYCILFINTNFDNGVKEKNKVQ
jgi:hypothetical protein